MKRTYIEGCVTGLILGLISTAVGIDIIHKINEPNIHFKDIVYIRTGFYSGCGGDVVHEVKSNGLYRRYTVNFGCFNNRPGGFHDFDSDELKVMVCNK